MFRACGDATRNLSSTQALLTNAFHLHPVAPPFATLQGLQQRDAKQRAQLDELAQSLADAQIELACFRALQARELRAAPDRAAAARALVASQREREAELQARFRALTQRRDDLLEALRADARQQRAAAKGPGHSQQTPAAVAAG